MTPDRHSNSSDQPKTLSQLSILVHTSQAGVKDRESWYKEAKVAYIFLSRCSGSLIENCVSVIVLCDVVGSFFSLFAQTLFPPTISLICLQHTCAAVTHLGIRASHLSHLYSIWVSWTVFDYKDSVFMGFSHIGDTLRKESKTITPVGSLDKRQKKKKTV